MPRRIKLFTRSAAGSEFWEIRKPGRHAMVKRNAPPWCADLTGGVGGSVVNQYGIFERKHRQEISMRCEAAFAGSADPAESSKSALRTGVRY